MIAEFTPLSMIGAIILTAAVSYIIYRRSSNQRRKQKLYDAIAKKRLGREASIGHLVKLLETTTIEFDPSIVKLDFETLCSRLKNDKLTPIQVLLAFQKQAISAHKATNCVVEFLFEANEWARELTETYYKTGKEKPPLYGIPISLKENFKVKGHDNTIGLAQFIDRPAADDCWLVRNLKRSGAVPFVLTNVPQTLLGLGSSNPIFGTTLNPWDSGCTPGGSTSGEAALVALRGSPLGFGTDIGGGLRVPAHFCGVFALKPTAGRMSQQGRVSASLGTMAIRGSAGLLAPSVSTLVDCCRSLWKDSSYDPTLAHIPLDETMLNQKNLKIGFYVTDSIIDPAPVCKEAIEEAAHMLENLGHILVPFEPFDIHAALTLYQALLSPDSGQSVRDLIAMDVVEDTMRRSYDFSVNNAVLESLGIHGVFKHLPTQNLVIFQELCAQCFKYREDFINRLKNEEIDCVLCPVWACPAPPVEQPPETFLLNWNFCTLFNLLDYPVGVVPCLLGDREGLEAYPTYATSANLGKMADEALSGTRIFRGLPIGVQVVAGPFQEEICMRVMLDLESQIKSRQSDQG